MYELLDRLRGIVFHYCKQLNAKYCDPRLVQYFIEDTVHRNMDSFDLGVMERSQLFELYTKATYIVTELILGALMQRFMRKANVHPQDRWWREPDFPLPLGDLLGYNKDAVDIYPKYKYVLQQCTPIVSV